MKIKTIFFGTPAFAVSALESLVGNKRFDVVAVVTQPDRVAGRKQVLTPPPVKVFSQKKKIPVLQPEKLGSGTIKEILAYAPELAVVVAYGNLLPASLLAAVKRGFVNVHPSLLPRYRGASPITRAIIDGAVETGVSLMVLDEKMDHGPVIAQRTVSMSSDETTTSLREKLTVTSVSMLEDELVQYMDGTIIPTAQDDARATRAPRIETSDAHIDWHRDIASIERLVRAMVGVTPAWCSLAGSDTHLMIHRARVLHESPTVAPGTLCIKNDTLAIAARGGYVLVDELQLAGKNTVSAGAFLNGHAALIGSVVS